MKRKIGLAIALLVIAVPFAVYAQQGESITSELRPPGFNGGQTGLPTANVPAKVVTGVNCFDYYRFGSVQVNIDGNKASYSPGERLNITGQVINDNDYPIVDGSVFIKVFRKQPDSVMNHANGFNLVDQFFVDETFYLDKKAQKDIAFFWRVPEEAVSGDYQIVTYFTVDRKFNMLGLSFTDDVVGNSFDFAVANGTSPTVFFDKNSVNIDGNKYRFAAFPPRASKDGEVTVTAELVNDSETAQTVPVTWTLSSWDGQREQNILKKNEEQVLVEAKSKKTLAYKVSDTNQPVYYLTAEANYQDTKSLLNIRFVRQDVDKVRFNFPALTNFPLKAGEPTTLFTCLHGMGTADVVGNNKVVLSLIDQEGKTIHTYNYDGNVSGAMMGLKSDFTPKKDYTKLTLKADLYTNNILVDSSQLNYDCAQLGGAACQQLAAAAAVGKKDNRLAYLLIILLGLLLIAGLFVWLYKKTKSIIVLAALVVWGGLLGLPGGVDAKSVQWNKQVDDYFAYRWNRWSAGGWAPGLANPNFTITYKAVVKNESTGQIVADGGSVPVGTVLLFEPVPYEDTDISWFGSGYSSDSPYGHWVNKAKTPEEDRGECNTNDEKCVCNEEDYVNAVFDGDYEVFIPFNVHPAESAIDHNGSTAGLNCNPSGHRCVVTSVGQIRSQFTFESTYGKLYYRYRDHRHDREGCYGNNFPMRTFKPGIWGIGGDILGIEEDRISDEDYVLDVPEQKIDYTIQVAPPPNQLEQIEIRMLDKATSLPLSDYNSDMGYIVGGENYKAPLAGGESGEIEKNFIAKDGNPETFTVNAPAQLVSQGQNYVHASTLFNCDGVVTPDQGTLTDGGSCRAVVRYKKLSDEAVNISLVGLSEPYHDGVQNADLFKVGGTQYKTAYESSFSDNAGDYVPAGQTRTVTVTAPEIDGYTHETPDDYTDCAGGVLSDGGICKVKVVYTSISAINAECGPAAKPYSYNATAFQGALCKPLSAKTVPLTVSFPAQGETSTWICKGKNGGSDSGNCNATRKNPTWDCEDGECAEGDCNKTVNWTCSYGLESRSPADCIANGKVCQDDVCPACLPEDRGGWREVAP